MWRFCLCLRHTRLYPWQLGGWGVTMTMVQFSEYITHACDSGGGVVVFAGLSSLAALEIVILTISRATGGWNYVWMATFSFRWWAFDEIAYIDTLVFIPFHDPTVTPLNILSCFFLPNTALINSILAVSFMFMLIIIIVFTILFNVRLPAGFGYILLYNVPTINNIFYSYYSYSYGSIRYNFLSSPSIDEIVD